MARKRGKFEMPSVWDSSDVPDAASLQVCTPDWLCFGVPNSDWSRPIRPIREDGLPTNIFTAVVVKPAITPRTSRPRTLLESLGFGRQKEEEEEEEEGEGGENGFCRHYEVFVALRGPNGRVVVANADGTVTADAPFSGDLPEECVLRFTRTSPFHFSIWSMSNERYLKATPDGSLLFVSSEVAGEEKFRVRRVESVPKFFGPNLGGWLVTEAWMCPAHLYDGVHKDLMDGTSIQLQAGDGRWTCAEGGGGGELVANRDEPSAWETFHLRRSPSGGLHLRSNSGHFWAIHPQTMLLSASSERGGQRETFWMRRKVGEEDTVQLRASNGNWVQVMEDGSLVADIDEDVPGWNTTCTMKLRKLSDMGGEMQLVLALGREEAEKRLRKHREEWIREEDFDWMAAHGVNSVRIPVGWWIAKSPAPSEFVDGSLEYLDKAFEWAEARGIRVVVCLHAAQGSQNGWEHSASRDGIPNWGKPGTTFVAQTLETIEFIVDRYGERAAFAALEPINEPRADSISFKDLSRFYSDCYAILRKHSPQAYFIIEGRIFANEREWDSFMTGPEFTNVIYDAHWYQVHDHAVFEGQSESFNLNYPSTQRLQVLKLLQHGRRLVIIGEWSLALLCKTSDEIYNAYGRAQVEAYSSASGGFFFWSLKHGQGWEPWSFQRAVEKKWLEPSWWGGRGSDVADSENGEKENGDGERHTHDEL